MPGCHLKEYTFCASFLHVQKYLISIAHDHCCLMVLVAILAAVALSQCTGIFGCGLWMAKIFEGCFKNHPFLAI